MANALRLGRKDLYWNFNAFCCTVFADVSSAYGRSAQAKAISAGSRWPACLGTQRRSRPSGFLHDFAMVERSEFA